MGVYAATGQLLDITGAIDELASDVPPAFMQAVSHGDSFFGVPQHVDTSALVFRPDLLREAGITSVPDRLEDAWSWEELSEVADKLTDTAPDGASAFAVNWQALGAFRWLNFLFQAGGHLYTEDRTSAAIGDPDSADAKAGIKALDFTRGFFERGWVPASTSTKSATYPDSLFTAGKLSMLYAGNFLLPAFADTIGDRFEYAATYLPQDARRASELGGNALVATRSATNPDLAAAFLVYMSDPAQMADFCAAATLLPTRSSIDAGQLEFASGAELMPVYAEQITTIEQRDVADVTTPTFTEVLNDLANELESCFLGGRSSEETLRVLAERIDETASLNTAGTAS
jgi:multiple sugar transport system substrate-binding protein